MACITNTAYIDAARAQARTIYNQAFVDTAIMAALALWQRNSSRAVAKMQEEIAKRQMALAEAVHEHAKKFWPHEKRLVEDAFAVGKYEAKYQSTGAIWRAMLTDSMRKGLADFRQVMKENCIHLGLCDANRWQRQTQLMGADALSFAARQEEAREQTFNDWRYGMQYNILQLGRGFIRTTMSYQDIAATMGENSAQILNSTINSALGALGYFRTRQQPQNWGVTATTNYDRMPYSPQRPVAAEAVQVHRIREQSIQAVDLSPRLTVDGGSPFKPAKEKDCGPEPAPDDLEGWLRYDECKGWK